MDWDKASAELEKKLDPANVKPPKSLGPKGEYIEGWHAIAEANRIFGFDGWSYVIKALTKDSVAEVEVTDRDGGTKMQWQAAYTCIVTVTVDGITREDVGFGSGFAKNVGDAIEGATKEAVTDALKRALRTFGNPFGLALYDKDKANVGKDDPKPDHRATADRLLGQIKRLKTVQQRAEWKKREGYALGVLRDQARPMFNEVITAAEKAELMDDPAQQAPDHVNGAFDEAAA